MMHHVLISLASNHQAEKHLHEARMALAELLSSVVYTQEIWTEPEGSTARSSNGKALYLNQLVSADTSFSADELNNCLKEIERRLGRTAECRLQGIVTIDLDLLQYDDVHHHLRDWNRSYVRCLLKLLDDMA